jgi:HupE/UreJ protein
MDEWFVNLQVQNSRAIQGVFRVPADQVEGLSKDPIVFLGGDQRLVVNWLEEGPDKDGRMKLRVSSNSEISFEELTIQVPAELLDENQSLVGFLQIDEQEPTTILIPQGGKATFAMHSPHKAPPSVKGFVKLGLTHIVEGYDHLLFLFCLLIAGGTLRNFLVVITAFTVGHSITLGASVLGYISLPSSLTETIIALSIVIAALLNLKWLDSEPKSQEDSFSNIKSRGLLAGSFGLIHGLGFAGILKEIGVEGSGVAAPLLGFNLGVELGQLVLVVLFYPVLIAINRWDKRIAFWKGCSILAALVGCYWMFERMGIL